ncbi:MAG: YraN family protein [Bdellovibrio sp.]
MSPRTAPVSCIARPSQASKNTSTPLPKEYWAHQQGLKSEQRVLEVYRQKGYQLLQQRLRTPFAEVDLLMRSPQGHLVLIEVKTSSLDGFQNYRLSAQQKKRLERALHFLAESFQELIEMHWAFVTREGEMILLEDLS